MDQMNLIDVSPEHSSDIVACIKRYKHAQTVKSRATDEEKEEVKALLDLIEAENLERLPDGSIKFAVDGYEITVIPREDSVKVKGSGEVKE